MKAIKCPIKPTTTWTRHQKMVEFLHLVDDNKEDNLEGVEAKSLS